MTETILTSILATAIIFHGERWKGDPNVVGDRGHPTGEAIGPGQIRPIGRRDIERLTGIRMTEDDCRDLRKTKIAIAKYMKALRKKHPHATVAQLASAWNAGEDAIWKGEAKAYGDRVSKAYWREWNRRYKKGRK